jgi:hypothetical protein
MELLGLLAAVVVLTIVLTRFVARSMVSNTYDEMATARWVPGEQGPAHAPLAPTVDALVVEGYAVDSYARMPMQPRSMPAVALVHPDGSLATGMVQRPLAGRGQVRLLVETHLAGGRHDVATASFGNVVVPATTLLEVASRRTDVGVCLARHRAAVRFVAERGVALHRYRLGDAAAAQEAGMRRAAVERVPVSVLRVLARQVTGGGRYRRPLAEQPGIEARLAEIRAQQEAGISG